MEKGIKNKNLIIYFEYKWMRIPDAIICTRY